MGYGIWGMGKIKDWRQIEIIKDKIGRLKDWDMDLEFSISKFEFDLF